MKWLFAVLSVFAVLIVGLLVAPSFFDWNKYKAQIFALVDEQTGYTLTIDGDISMAILPSPSLYLEDVMIKDPSDKSGARVLAALKRLKVNVELGPLLSKKIVIDSIELEQPSISLIKNADGVFNFMTPKIEAMMVGEEGNQPKDNKEPAFDVAFDSVKIIDGAFKYQDGASDAPLEISSIDMLVQAGSLSGPFVSKGDLLFNQKPVIFEAKTGEVDMKLQSTSLNLKANYDGIDVSYAGVVSGGEAPEIQGQTSVLIKSLSNVMGEGGANATDELSGALSINGLLTANAQSASFKDAVLKIAGQSLNGSIDAGFAPITVVGAFKGQDVLNLDPYIKSDDSKSSEAVDPLSFGAMLPKTLELPVIGEIDLSVSVPGVVFKGQTLKNVTLGIKNKDKGFALDVKTGSILGQGQVAIGASLDFVEVSKSADASSVTYSKPSARFSMKGQSQNLPQTITAFTGMKDLPLVKDTKKGLWDVRGTLSPSRLSIDNAVINMDKSAFDISGSWAGQNGSKRSLLKTKVVASQLNFDSFMGEKAGSQKSNVDAKAAADPLAPLKTLSLPYDADIDVTINDAVLQGHAIKGLNLAAALRPNVLKLNQVAARDFAGTSFNVQGGINDLKTMSKLNLNINMDSSDPYKLAQTFDMDTSSWPKNMGATKAGIVATGSVNALDLDANVRTLGGTANIKGRVADAMSQAKISGLVARVTHPNMAQALKSFGASAPEYASFSKPLDLKTNVDMDGAVTHLRDINANLAGASVTGDLKYDTGGVKPMLNGTLRISDLILKSTTSGGASAAGNSAGAKWSSDPIETGWLHMMNANLDIAANRIVYESWDMSKPALKVVIKDGVADIQNLQAGLYDGQIVMKGALSSASANAPLDVNIDSKINNINLGALTTALAGAKKLNANGNVSLDFNVKGNGVSQKALVQSLNGNANLDGQDFVMQGFNLAGLAGALMESNKPLSRIQQVLSASVSGGETAFGTIQGAYTIQNGVVRIGSMIMDGPAAKIESSGLTNILQWGIDTQHAITLKNTTGVDPFNISISGSLDNPVNTFGSGLFDTFLRQKLEGKVMEKLPDVLGDDVADKLKKFGVLPSSEDGDGSSVAPIQDIVNDPAAGIGSLLGKALDKELGQKSPSADVAPVNDNASPIEKIVPKRGIEKVPLEAPKEPEVIEVKDEPDLDVPPAVEEQPKVEPEVQKEEAPVPVEDKVESEPVQVEPSSAPTPANDDALSTEEQLEDAAKDVLKGLFN